MPRIIWSIRDSIQNGLSAELSLLERDDNGNLANLNCVPCRKGEPQATEKEIADWFPQIPEWRLVEHDGIKRLERTYRFKDFSEALSWTNKAGKLAEAAGHHPAILTEWGQVTVTWWTHKIGGLHRNDFIMASKTDALYG